jgi:hypothetical protein
MNLLDRALEALDRETEGEVDGPAPLDVDRGVRINCIDVDTANVAVLNQLSYNRNSRTACLLESFSRRSERYGTVPRLTQQGAENNNACVDKERVNTGAGSA